MAKVAKIKNVGNVDFTLSLQQVSDGKFFVLKPGSTVPVNEDELSYLCTECQGAFNKGYLEVVSSDEKIKETVDIPETKNNYTIEEMTNIVNMPIAKFRKALKEIDASHVLADIRNIAEENNKSAKVMEAIDERISEVATSLVL